MLNNVDLQELTYNTGDMNKMLLKISANKMMQTAYIVSFI